MNLGLSPHHSKFLDYAQIVGEEYKRLRLEEGQRELKDRLGVLLQKIDNKTCADCGREGPRWANTNLGLFFCIDCSTAHRNLGGGKLEKSRNLVKSVHRDIWTASQVEAMERRGNKKGNEYFEAGLPSLSPEKRSKPKQEDSPLVKEKYIKDKYQHKLFTPENLEELLADPVLPSQISSEEPSKEVLTILRRSKSNSERTALEELLLEKYERYQEEIQQEKERRKREVWNRERIAEVKQQTTELARLNVMKSILDKKKMQGREKDEKIFEERKKELDERRERLEKRKERLAESERRRWETVRRAAQREAEKEREKKLLLGRDVGDNPYSSSRGKQDDVNW